MKKLVQGAIFVHILIALVVVGGIALSISAFKDHVSPRATVYCSPDGILSDTQPIQSHRSYCIKSNLAALSAQPNTPVTLSFSIVDDQGSTVKDFRMMHEMLLHLIVVRQDLNSFQHLHPDFDETTGQFALSNLTFPTPGPYRIFADFTPSGTQLVPDGMPLAVTISEDVTIAGAYSPQSIGAATRTKSVGGYEVTLSTDPQTPASGMTMLSFAIKKDGAVVVNLEPYLAALGHSVVLKQDSLDYIHAHALQEPSSQQNGTIDFHVEFPYGGNYKIFTQFKHAGQVHTVEFVVPVTGEAAPTTESGMEHRGHVMPNAQ